MLIRVEPVYDDWTEHITRIDLERAWQSLCAQEREIAELYLYHGKSLTAIARQLQRPRRAVETLLHSALAKLQEALR